MAVENGLEVGLVVAVTVQLEGIKLFSRLSLMLLLGVNTEEEIGCDCVEREKGDVDSCVMSRRRCSAVRPCNAQR